MVLSIFDNILLGSLKRFRGDTFEERIENFGFLFFYSGVALAFCGSVLMLAPMFILTTLFCLAQLTLICRGLILLLEMA